MKVFFDTNILLEVLLDREYADSVEKIIEYCERYNHTLCSSTGSIYTLVYTVDKYLKKESGISNPERTGIIRELLQELMSQYLIVDADNSTFVNAIDDKRMTDLEDSFQLQIAKRAECDVFVTINIKDFKNSMVDLPVVTPASFIESYLI